MMRRIRTAVPIAVAAAVVVTLSGPAPAVGSSDSPPAAATTAATYRNPLPLTLPNGHQAESCADPSVIKGQQAGDKYWYLYCTSDVLDSTERDSSGNTVLHNLPMYKSLDLTHWA